MSEYYVDPDATGNDDGSTKPNAWTSLQRAIDGTDGTQPAAGDVVLLKHGTGADETLTVSIDVDGNGGDYVSGYIKYIGVNSSWVNDGTYYDIDANNAATHCMNVVNTSDNVWFENMIFRKATSHGVNYSQTGTYGNIFNHCSALNNGGRGIYGYGNNLGGYYRCLFAENSSDGLYCYGNEDKIMFSVSRGNSGRGYYSVYGDMLLYGSIAFDNTNNNVQADYGSLILNSVIDNSVANGIYCADNRINIIGCRITNESSAAHDGINANSKLTIGGWNYFDNNVGDNKGNAAVYNELLYNGASTDIEDSGDVNQGYTSLTAGSEDYNLRSDATLRRTPIQLETGQ